MVHLRPPSFAPWLPCLLCLLALTACPRPDWTPPSLKEAAPAGNGVGPGPRPSGPPLAAPNAPPLLPVATDFSRGVALTLEASQAPATKAAAVTFVVPLAPGRVKRLDEIAVFAAGKKLPARMSPVLHEFGPGGEKRGVRSVRFELDATVKLPLVVELKWTGGGGPVLPAVATFASTARKVTVSVDTARYGVEARDGSTFAAVPRDTKKVALFEAVEPPVRVLFPSGYLTETRLFGDLMTRADLERRGDLAGMRFLADAFVRFADGAMGQNGYLVHPSAIEFETEAWLYDRCATFLLAYAHAGEARHLSHGLHSCARYVRDIGLDGERRGFHSGKKDPDLKYSHARGLYAYFALTGDEAALEAGKAMAEMWSTDPLFVLPYRAGHTRGYDKLWTERLLAAALEGGVYGFLLTGEPRFLESARELMKTAIKHVTTADPAELKTITKTAFPPQSCFIHNALQQAEGNPDEPWCSSWMSELVVDPMLRYQELTGEPAVDEIFVRLARSMRDVGTMYFKDNPLNDAFLTPSRPFVMDDEPRLLAPLYGYGIDDKGKRRPSGEWSDFEHCPDATALTAAALRALKRQKRETAPPVPASPAFKVDLSRFKTEQDSFVALHQELAFCAAQTLERARRENRDPRTAKQALLSSAYAGGDAKAQFKALDANKIGWPVYDSNPRRKLSWWFNTSIGVPSWLAESGVPMTAVKGGVIR